MNRRKLDKSSTAAETPETPAPAETTPETPAAPEPTQAPAAVETAPRRSGEEVRMRVVQARRAEDPTGALVLLLAPDEAQKLPGLAQLFRAVSVEPAHAPTTRRARRGAPATKPRTRVTHANRGRKVATRTTGVRGRIAGRYLVGTKEPEYLTDSIGDVYKLIARHKKGLTAKDISGRLDMPMGTVGWALQMLKRSGALQYEASID